MPAVAEPALSRNVKGGYEGGSSRDVKNAKGSGYDALQVDDFSIENLSVSYPGVPRVKIDFMRYLVRAKVKPGKERALLHSIENESLGQGSVAEGEYLRNMKDARLCADGTARWVEVCYCPTPLQEERPYWEEYFDLTKVQDAHDRRRCRDQNGTEYWSCSNCDCTERLEKKLAETGTAFLDALKRDESKQAR